MDKLVRLNEVASDLGVSKRNCFKNYNELLHLNEIEGVIIATPDHHQFPPAIAAIKAGKHVYCEKAMANRILECTELVKKAKESDQIFYVGHNVRFMSASKRLHQLISALKQGKLFKIKAEEYEYKSI